MPRSRSRKDILLEYLHRSRFDIPKRSKSVPVVEHYRRHCLGFLLRSTGLLFVDVPNLNPHFCLEYVPGRLFCLTPASLLRDIRQGNREELIHTHTSKPFGSPVVSALLWRLCREHPENQGLYSDLQLGLDQRQQHFGDLVNPNRRRQVVRLQAERAAADELLREQEEYGAWFAQYHERRIGSADPCGTGE